MEETSSMPFFDTGSPFLSHPLLTPERTRTEVDRIEAAVGSVRTRRVLDIGCGFGRHSIEFARRGAEVTAIDPSLAMVEAARQRADEAGVYIDVACSTAQELRDVAHFDLAVCLFSTLGQRDPHAAVPEGAAGDEPDRELLVCTRRALRPGGHLVIEVPERDRAVEAMVDSETLGTTSVGRCYDPETSLLTERFDLADGRSFDLANRLYSSDEITAMLEDAAFEIEAVVARALAPPPETFATVIARRAG